MHIWLLQDGEPIPGIDNDTRPWRGSLLAEALVERGHRVTWWTATFDHVTKRFRREYTSTVLLRPGLSVRMLHGPGYRSSTGLQRFAHQRAIARAFAVDTTALPPPDLVVAGMPTLELAEQATRFAQSRSVPVMIDVRDAWPDQYLTLFPAVLQPLARMLLGTEFARLRRLLKAADGISAVSQTYLDWALANAGRAARPADAVFPLGFVAASRDTRRVTTAWQGLKQRFQLHEDQVLCVFAGGCNSSIELRGVLAAAAQLAPQFPALRIVIAGDGDRLAQWQRQARGLPQVIFTGRLDRFSLTALLDHAAVGLAPYRQGTLISLPNKPFEYLAAGLPVLNGLPGELSRLLQEHDVGVSCNAADGTQCTAALQSLIADPQQRSAMAQRGRQLASAYQAEAIAAQMALHLEHLAEEYRLNARNDVSAALRSGRVTTAAKAQRV